MLLYKIVSPLMLLANAITGGPIAEPLLTRSKSVPEGIRLQTQGGASGE